MTKSAKLKLEKKNKINIVNETKNPTKLDFNFEKKNIIDMKNEIKK